MKVFSGYLKCVRGNIRTIIMYCSIFLVLSVMMVQVSGKREAAGSYDGTRLSIAVADEDHSVWSEALTAYLGKYHDIKDLGEDRKVLAEALYYDQVFYVVSIPKDFEENCLKGEEKLEVMTQPQSSNEYYVDTLLDLFVHEARIYLAAGYTDEDAAEAVLETGDIKGETMLTAKEGSHVIYNVFRFMPYLYLSILCFTMGFVQREYQGTDIRRRMLASCVSLKNQVFQMFLAFVFVGVIIWCICSAMGAVLCWNDFMETGNKWYILGNGFTSMLSSLAIAFLVGTVGKTYGAINGMANVISLGFCFLGGVFVPLEMLSEPVKRVGMFLPSYWYAQNISILSLHENMTAGLKSSVHQGMLIQLIFAAASVAAALAVKRARQQEE